MAAPNQVEARKNSSGIIDQGLVDHICTQPFIIHTIHQELTPLPKEHQTILDAVMADGLEDDSRCLMVA